MKKKGLKYQIMGLEFKASRKRCFQECGVSAAKITQKFPKPMASDIDSPYETCFSLKLSCSRTLIFSLCQNDMQHALICTHEDCRKERKYVVVFFSARFQLVLSPAGAFQALRIQTFFPHQCGLSYINATLID